MFYVHPSAATTGNHLRRDPMVIRRYSENTERRIYVEKDTTSTSSKDRSTTRFEKEVVSVNKNINSNDNNIYSDLLPTPNPSFDAIDVVTSCMNTLIENRHDTKIGLDVCYAFSNDRCRAAIGGNINEFYLYANNPTFTYLTSCISYNIIATGPIINGTTHRGAMQTILTEIIPSITTSMTSSTTTTTTTAPTSTQFKNPSPTPATPTTPRRFLWTLQQERRPPLQHCWMIHEVLYTKNAFQQTM